MGFSSASFAQKQVRKEVRNGNKEYKQEKYSEAEVNYRRALESNARSTEAAYNLGNSLYKQEKRQEALEQYLAITNNETDKEKLANAWHNIGNIFLSMKDSQNTEEQKAALPKSIEAYKKALRNNPKDEETRYNLALAQKLLQDQQNEDQNQDQQDQQKEKEKEKEQEQEQKQDQQQDQQEQQQEQQQQNSNEMSKESAEQILDAMMQEEKNTQKKVKEQQMRQQQSNKKDKNW